MIELCPPCSARNVRESGSNARWPNRLCSPSIDFRWLQVLPRLADLNIGDAQHLYCQASAFWPVNELKLGMRMHFRVERLCLAPSDCSNLIRERAQIGNPLLPCRRTCLHRLSCSEEDISKRRFVLMSQNCDERSCRPAPFRQWKFLTLPILPCTRQRQRGAIRPPCVSLDQQPQ